ncbi:hypothetical protein AB1Y20_017572 [Prymnesium parvum]|mmetsp:Transcript_9296/g.19449  ORF Transcript_9296/g.19449 Transcript_9296/m.19449 type:complete len:193 (-) Transcript_9296:52-630(-)
MAPPPAPAPSRHAPFSAINSQVLVNQVSRIPRVGGASHYNTRSLGVRASPNVKGALVASPTRQSPMKRVAALSDRSQLRALPCHKPLGSKATVGTSCIYTLQSRRAQQLLTSSSSQASSNSSAPSSPWRMPQQRIPAVHNPVVHNPNVNNNGVLNYRRSLHSNHVPSAINSGIAYGAAGAMRPCFRPMAAVR